MGRKARNRSFLFSPDKLLTAPPAAQQERVWCPPGASRDAARSNCCCYYTLPKNTGPVKASWAANRLPDRAGASEARRRKRKGNPRRHLLPYHRLDNRVKWVGAAPRTAVRLQGTWPSLGLDLAFGLVGTPTRVLS